MKFAQRIKFHVELLPWQPNWKIFKKFIKNQPMAGFQNNIIEVVVW